MTRWQEEESDSQGTGSGEMYCKAVKKGGKESKMSQIRDPVKAHSAGKKQIKRRHRKRYNFSLWKRFTCAQLLRTPTPPQPRPRAMGLRPWALAASQTLGLVAAAGSKAVGVLAVEAAGIPAFH
jgi:hypothetical protein